MSSNDISEAKPLMSTESRIDASDSWTDVDDFGIVSEHVARTEDVLSSLVLPLIKNDDERVEVLHRNCGRIGVRVQKEISQKVYEGADVRSEELRRTVSMAHNFEMEHVIQYSSGGTNTTEEFVFQDPDANDWHEPYASTQIPR